MTSIKRDRTLYTGNRHHLPLPTGPFTNIGFYDIMTGTDKTNGVFVRILYPASDQSTGVKDRVKEWPNWFPHENYRTGYMNVANVWWTPLVKCFNYFSPNVFIPILQNVDPISAEEHTFPVIIFSHGVASCRTAYSNICYELASYGFIVFAVEHRDQSACMSFCPSTDESKQFEWIPYRHSKTFPNDYEIRSQQLEERVADISKTIVLLNDLQNGVQFKNQLQPQMDSQKFAGLFDLNKLVVMGHSFGAATAIKSMLSIECIQLGICLDGWMYPIKDVNSTLVTKPLLFVNMETFQFKTNLTKMKQFIENDGKNTDQRKVFTMKEARHSDQSDIPFILNSCLLWLFHMKSKVDPFFVHDVTTALTLDFIADGLQMKLKKDKKEFIEKYRNQLIEGLID